MDSDNARPFTDVEAFQQGESLAAALRLGCRKIVPVPHGFVGRSRELVRLAIARKTSRVVTLLGPGGIGKTRLAVEYTRGRVPLIALNGVRTVSELAEALRETLGLRTPGAIRAEPTSPEWIASRLPSRLILDNAEGLDRAAVDLVAQLLTLAPRLSLTITSRRALGLPGETLLLLQPLSDKAARRLFLRCADKGGRRPTLQLLDSAQGLPLAIEIAARGGTLPQLRPSQRVLLASLAVFAHSWSDEDANAVCGPIDPFDLDALENACLIGRRGLETRWRMLVPVREAVRHQVPQILLEAAHTARFEALALAGDQDGLNGAEIELGAVLERLFEDGQIERAARMTVALSTWAQATGRLDFGERWLKNASEQVLPRELHVEVLDALGRVLLAAGRYEESETCLRDVLPFYEEVGNVRLEGRAYLNLGTALRMMSRSARAETETRRSIFLLRSINDERLLGVGSNNLAQILGDEERWTEAVEIQREAVGMGPSPSRRLRLAEALLHSGGKAEASEIVGQVLRENPETGNRILGELLRSLIFGAVTGESRQLLAQLDKMDHAAVVWKATRRLVEASA